MNNQATSSQVFIDDYKVSLKRKVGVTCNYFKIQTEPKIKKIKLIKPDVERLRIYSY